MDMVGYIGYVIWSTKDCVVLQYAKRFQCSSLLAETIYTIYCLHRK